MTGPAVDGERSFERVNYAVRPAKATQRHMVAEAVARLSAFAPLREYAYVGFGSTYFVDFRLLHQRFGIHRMFSIENATEKARRFELNKPFSCIRMLFGESSDMLTSRRIGWRSRPTIVWLDYDDQLDRAKLSDVERVLRYAQHGSMLLVTFDCEPPREDPGEADRHGGEPASPWRERARRLLKPLEPYVAVRDHSDATLNPEAMAAVGCSVLDDVARELLEDERPRMRFQPIIRFRYQDGRAMATWGGLLFAADEESMDAVRAAALDDLPWARSEGREPYPIVVPNLTAMERTLIESDLPTRPAAARRRLESNDIPLADVAALEEIYRYAPRFVETSA